jgi:hypothetical protein
VFFDFTVLRLYLLFGRFDFDSGFESRSYAFIFFGCFDFDSGFDFCFESRFHVVWVPHSSPVLGRVGVLPSSLMLVLNHGSSFYLFRVPHSLRFLQKVGVSTCEILKLEAIDSIPIALPCF